MHTIIQDIEFELNTICNSFCPICSRYTNHDNELWLNPHLKLNRQLEFETIRKVFDTTDRWAEDLNINLIGTAGEPSLHPEFIDIVKYIRNKFPKAFINIHTNGGCRNVKFWRELGQVLDGTHHNVSFSLDGLEDTHGIYRIGVDFNKAVTHLQAFLDAGGKGIWKFIQFEWNKHQVEEARQRAKDMGCHRFQMSTNVCDDKFTDEIMSAAANKINKFKYAPSDWDSGYLEPVEWDNIDTKCMTEQGIFVDIEGRILPCCMYYSDSIFAGTKKLFKEIMYKDQQDWNSIHLHDTETILQHDWWNTLKQSFSTNPNYLCQANCGRCGDERAHYDVDFDEEEF